MIMWQVSKHICLEQYAIIKVISKNEVQIYGEYSSKKEAEIICNHLNKENKNV